MVKDLSLAPDREALARELGRQLALIHRIRPPRADLAFFGAPPADQLRADIAWLRASLDALGLKRPALEWSLAELEAVDLPAAGPVLIHRDFRTGNYMVDGEGLTAILDWEFAAWGDPMSDLGWFSARCWRFSRPDLEAGGIGTRAAFYAGYEAAGGRAVDDRAVRIWEIMAHLRWAVIALQQGARTATEPSLELALTARIAPELELAALRATAPGRLAEIGR